MNNSADRLLAATGFPAPNALTAIGHRLEPQSFDSWVAAFQKHPEERPSEKTLGPGWSPALFRDDKRSGGTVESIWALCFDVDEEPVPELVKLRAYCGRWRGFVYASWSHKFECNDNPTGSARWRLVLLLSRDVTADEYRRLWEVVRPMLGFPVGQQAKDPSRLWFLPCRSDDGAHHFAEFKGEPIDVEAMLSQAAPASGVTLVEPMPVSVTQDMSRRDTSANILGKNWPQKGRHQAQLALAGALARDGWPEEEALEFLCQVCRLAGDEDRPKREATIRDTYAKKENGEKYSGWEALGKQFGNDVFVGAARDMLKHEETWSKLSALVQQSAAAQPLTLDDDVLSKHIDVSSLTEADAEIDWLVDQILPTASVGAFVAQPYALKTWAAYSLAVAVSKGEKWLGRFPTKQGRVMVLDFEMGPRRTRKRLRSLGGDDRIVRVHHPESMLSQRTFEAIVKRRPALVIVDSLSAGNRADDENDPKFALPLDLAKRVVDACGASFIFIHHEVKDTSGKAKHKRVRGTGAIFGALDVCYSLDVESEKRSEVRCIKMRDGEEPKPFHIRLNEKTLRVELYEELRAIGPVAGSVGDLATQIKFAITHHGPDVSNAIAKRLVKREKDVRDEVKILLERGELVKIDRKLHVDNDLNRLARIRKTLEDADAQTIAWNSISTSAKLANAAHVDTQFVNKLEREGTLIRSSDGDSATWFFKAA